jgi:MFS family permease
MQSTPHARRETRATLAAGLFTNGVWDMLSVVVPLYGVAVGLSVAEIGLVVAARSVLPTALSVHGGILMDRWGTHRVLLWLSLASVLLPLLYPLSGWFSALVALQLLLGLASSLGMAASQTWSLQSSRSDTAALARYSLVTRIGTFVAPVMVGAIWDAFGAWPAFVCIAFWASGVVAAALYGASAQAVRFAPARAPSAAPRRALGAVLPRWAEHKDAFALAAIPAVAFVLAVSFLRNAPGAIQASLYVVYLENVGFGGAMIGALIGLSEGAGVIGSLVAAPTERRVRARPLVIVCIVTSLVSIALTPFIAHSLFLLIVAAGVRGFGQGLSQPLMYSLLGRAVPATVHGATVGLRNSVTRLASIVTPAVMGVVAGVWGVEASFYAIGAILLVATFALPFVARPSVANAR